MLDGVGLDDELVVVGAEQLGDHARACGSSLKRSCVEADREGLDRPRRGLGHRRDDRRGVDAAGQERAERHVGDHPPAHRAARMPSRMRLVAARVGRDELACARSRAASSARSRRVPSAHSQRVAGGSLRTALERAQRRRARTVGEVGVERLVVDARAGSSGSSSSASAPSANESVPSRVRRRRAASCRPGRARAAAGAARRPRARSANMPCRERHAVRALLLVEVDDHLGVAAACANRWPAPLEVARAAPGSCRSRRSGRRRRSGPR